MALYLIFQVELGCQLDCAEYIFTFEGREFRLVRGTATEMDKLCTIVRGDRSESIEAYRTALKLCDCLNWQWRGGGVRCLDGGGPGCKDETKLEDRPVSFFRARRLHGLLVHLDRIPSVPTQAGYLALSLMNEAAYSNSEILSIINYWKILEIPGPTSQQRGKPQNRAMNWIDAHAEKFYMSKLLLAELAKHKVSLGKYLYNYCRNAVAHVTHPPTVFPSDPSQLSVMSAASGIAARFAECYIEEVLGVRRHAKPIPIRRKRERSDALKFLKNTLPPFTKRRTRSSAEVVRS